MKYPYATKVNGKWYLAQQEIPEPKKTEKVEETTEEKVEKTVEETTEEKPKKTAKK